ncbi:MAG: hypothetical protein ONB44_14645 [candidate division KSB1 bacterium]|nr:hypothetical protein [candidate division KSB1 bacterium]MDZ7303366.1 hypothetical protein [candidate division KSB1 bacterium]MDZ7312316.1 hypothetical protein [candidate division KSB1 bacterium]
MDILARIKRLVLTGKVIFTLKAQLEIEADQLTEDLVCEAILNAPAIAKIQRSRKPESGKREILYVIKGLTYDGLLIYTKGKFKTIGQQEVFYVVISSKRSTD